MNKSSILSKNLVDLGNKSQVVSIIVEDTTGIVTKNTTNVRKLPDIIPSITGKTTERIANVTILFDFIWCILSYLRSYTIIVLLNVYIIFK